MSKPLPMPERFWSKVDRRSPDDCWPWTASLGRYGYGIFWMNGRKWRATRIAWELVNGRPFPDDMLACHSCDNPICVNPTHIWPGTYRDNAMDAISKGRLTKKPSDNPRWLPPNAAKKECKRGHPFDEANTIMKAGHRMCRICTQAYRREYAQRQKDKAARTALGKGGV